MFTLEEKRAVVISLSTTITSALKTSDGPPPLQSIVLSTLSDTTSELIEAMTVIKILSRDSRGIEDLMTEAVR